MPAPIDSYPALKRYRLELPQDATVYEQGVAPPFFYLLLNGRVVFEVLDASGARTAVEEVEAGSVFGVVSAFSGRPASAAARTTTRTQLLAIPVSAAPEAFRQSPELAVAIIRELAQQPFAQRSSATPTDSDSLMVPLDTIENAPALEERASAAPVQMPASGGSANDQWFFRDEVQCPSCRHAFAYLRVRASAVRPAGRDSDFRIAYRTVDPSLYAVLVCPDCAYASYVEDFAELTSAERRALIASQGERMALATRNFCGERTVDDAALALLLAQLCAEARGAGLRRKAGLLHRRAWLERTRGNIEAEQALLRQTRDAYMTVYEQDPDIQDAAAMRVAYLIGDLTLRLGDAVGARRWLLECTRMPVTEHQEGLIRMARMRLDDAREAQGSLPRSA